MVHALVLSAPIYLPKISMRSVNYLRAEYISCDQSTYLPAAYHAIGQPIYRLCTMRSINLSTSCVPCNRPTYLRAVDHAIDLPIYQLRTMQSTNLSTTCVQNYAINQSIYELYVMQLISTVEPDSKVILLLVNLYVQLLPNYL